MGEFRYKLFIEMFSVVTGLSFLLSALLHSLIFYFWGLDFISFATFEDVALGGIRLLFAGAAMATIVSGSFVLTTIQRHERLNKDPDRSLRRVPLVAALVWIVVVVAKAGWESRGQPFSMATMNAAFESMWLFMFAAGLLFLIVSLGAYRLGNPALFRQAMAEVAARRSFNLTAAAAATFVLVVVMFAAGRYYSNIRIADGVPIPAQCAAAEDYTIRWIGSKAIVLECRSHLAVLLYGEDRVVFTRR